MGDYLLVQHAPLFPDNFFKFGNKKDTTGQVR